MNVEQRIEVCARLMAAMVGAPRILPLTTNELQKLAGMAVRGAAALEEAMAVSDQEHQAADMPLQPTDGSGREICRGCERPLERPGSGWCDSCWCAIAEASQAESIRLQQANVDAALALVCPMEGCGAPAGERCEGVDVVHPARMHAALAARP